MSNEEGRREYSYWKKSKDTFMKGIDKNKMLPTETKVVLKQLISEQFQFMGKIIGTTELIYLREKQHK
jgi:hypothetical protein